jgi:carbon monoxide dehydrogenase subunit G
MNVSGEHRVAASRERVWQALHNADILRACIPGCEDVRAVEPHVFAGRIVTRIGAVSTVFTGRLMVSDESYPKGWHVAAHAESPSAGWADGTASVHLAAVSGGTMVSYRMHVDPGGRLAAVGDRLLRAVAMRMATDFFNRLTELLMPEPQGGPPQDRSDPGTVPPRREVLPLAPTPEPPAPATSAASTPEPAGGPMPRGQRIIIGVGWAYCAFILLSMGLALLHRG